MVEGSGGRVSRRRFIGGTTATAGAVVAGAYVSPTLRSIGMPTAYAAVSAPDVPPPQAFDVGKARGDIEHDQQGEIPDAMPDTGMGGAVPVATSPTG